MLIAPMQSPFRSIGAVVLGLLVYYVSMVVMTMLAFFFLLRSTDVATGEDLTTSDQLPLIILGTAIIAGLTVLSAYVTATVAKDKLHAVALGIILGVFALRPIVFYRPNDMSYGEWAIPLNVAGILITIALCYLGGYLWEREQEKEKTTP